MNKCWVSPIAIRAAQGVRFAIVASIHGG